MSVAPPLPPPLPLSPLHGPFPPLHFPFFIVTPHVAQTDGVACVSGDTSGFFASGFGGSAALVDAVMGFFFKGVNDIECRNRRNSIDSLSADVSIVFGAADGSSAEAMKGVATETVTTMKTVKLLNT
ncbi:hypothetical protein [Novipirellula sp.]|uniref:hypothetical protein n=1 Tax=Novipirellula sp. TaxID=2795430 RepID=UPI003562F31E